MYKHTNNWFLTSSLKNWLSQADEHLRQRCNLILEIGSYEGMSSTYLLDTLCNHKDSKMICVDPFIMCNKDNFIHNTNLSKNKDKLTLHEITSDEYFKNCKYDFDLIYIDGDHTIPFLQRDLKNSWIFLKKGGIIWFDDYLGGHGDFAMKRAVDETICQWDYDVIHSGYQLAIRKK
tara:strand:- start:1121 stop:1648 length:528 start_codon:yes stop_codon:yes gene_type:complete